MAKKTRVKKKRVRLAFDEGLVFVHSSFNNTIISLTDRAGNVLAWSSGGKIDIQDQKQNFAVNSVRTSSAPPNTIGLSASANIHRDNMVKTCVASFPIMAST